MNILVDGIVKAFDGFDSVCEGNYIQTVLDCWSNDASHFDTQKCIYVMSNSDFQRLNNAKDKLLAVSRLISNLDDDTLSDFYRMLFAHFTSNFEESINQQLQWLKAKQKTGVQN